MTDGATNNHAAFIWSVADLLRGDYKQSDYGKVILPLTVIRRLDCVLAVSYTHLDVYKRQVVHPLWKDMGMRNVQDPWSKSSVSPEYPNGWLEDFRERWDQLPAPVKAQSES